MLLAGGSTRGIVVLSVDLLEVLHVKFQLRGETRKLQNIAPCCSFTLLARRLYYLGGFVSRLIAPITQIVPPGIPLSKYTILYDILLD